MRSPSCADLLYYDVKQKLGKWSITLQETLFPKTLE